ncbi:MAG TPA: class I SAM-dependent methyltransferase [Candidatus Poseidoniaceae archaeon]|nr:MAG TPA: class I SAM-dependent methyltransferase [Candidatus Poseidoniales archaeon]HII22771.1 class I SAM-dependent methyltransferase [Candidatus Poseidoniaceae archaeon]|tara:strand:+ start:493 stop:1119 length:627 start_codon:yes stop_codon:yes gene_type:complete
MAKRPATDVFHDWALVGKDEGMEKGHAASVSEMLEFIWQQVESTEQNFSAVDVGCGNGWVVRKLKSHGKCEYAMGIDGAEAMITKAKAIDRDTDYTLALLPDFQPKRKFDFIHSMEFLYYLKEPENMLKLFHDYWLNDSGWAVIGIDHYAENEDSLSWPDYVGVHMSTRTTEQWQQAWKDAGFENVKHWIAGGENGVTLVFVGQKKNS